MERQNLDNKWVTVSCFGETTADVVVVQDLGEVVLVCSQEERDMALKEGRKPNTVGFKRSAILAVAPEKKGVRHEDPPRHPISRAGD